MGTRGALGFYVAGVSKITYIHDNADFDHAGKAVVNYCRENTITNHWCGARKKALAMKKVDGDKPTSEQINEVLRLTLRQLPKKQGDTTWFDLLGHTQGEPGTTLHCKYYQDRRDFMYQSQYCEYAYIINFDTMKLEVYIGKQKQKHDCGRYTMGKGKKPNKAGYYPVKLVGKFDLLAIPDDWKARLRI